MFKTTTLPTLVVALFLGFIVILIGIFILLIFLLQDANTIYSMSAASLLAGFSF